MKKLKENDNTPQTSALWDEKLSKMKRDSSNLSNIHSWMTQRHTKQGFSTVVLWEDLFMKPILFNWIKCLWGVLLQEEEKLKRQTKTNIFSPKIVGILLSSGLNQINPSPC